MKVWKVELNDLLERIERHTSASLWRIKREFERCGLTFDRKFRKRFLRLTNNRLSETYDRVEIESMAMDQCNRGQHRHYDDSDRNAHTYGGRRVSEEHESYSKKSVVWMENKKERSLYSDRPNKYVRPHRLGGIHKRLGKKIESNDEQIDGKYGGLTMQHVHGSQHDSGGGSGGGGRNPFRATGSRSVATVTAPESVTTKSTDEKGRLQMIKVKVEMASPAQSSGRLNIHNGNGNGRRGGNGGSGSVDGRSHSSIGHNHKRKRDNDHDIEVSEVESDEVTIIQTPVKRQKANDIGASIDLDATTTLNDMVFHCVHCTDANAMNDSCYGSIDDVYGHWLSGHTDLQCVKPFWFYVTQSIACFHCNTHTNYYDMIKHYREYHADKALAMVRQKNRNECALCTYVGDDIICHFASEHDGLLQSQLFNPARLPESLLGDLFAIDIHKKRQCGWCNGIFETQHEIEAHHSVVHSDHLLKSNEYFDAKSAYVICDHCSSKVDGTKFFMHIEKHPSIFECSKCPYKTGLLIDLVAHEKDEHRKNSLNYHCMEFAEHLKKQFLNSKVIFGNGLVLINHNFKNTIYDDSHQFNAFIERLVGKIKMKFTRMTATTTTVDAAGKHKAGSASSRPSSVASSSNASETAIERLRSHSIDSHRNPFRVSTLNDRGESSSTEMTELQKQNQLDNNLSIVGLPLLRDDNVLEMFLAFCKKIKAKLSPNDVVDIYRDGGINDAVIVKFTNYELKNMVRNYAQVRQVWTNELVELPAGEVATKVYTNLHTTRYYCKMLNIAREARKTDSLFSYYLCKRGLAVRRTEHSTERIVLSTSELINYIYGNKYGDSAAQEHDEPSVDRPMHI